MDELAKMLSERGAARVGWAGLRVLPPEPREHMPFGSAIRLTTVLTDAEGPVGEPVGVSRCGECAACVEVCPANAPSGNPWHAGLHRDEFFDAFACRAAARRMAGKVGVDESICGMCIAACPWTKRYIERGLS